MITRPNNLKMAKRVSIMLEDDLVKKLRILQAKRISQTKKAASFSKIICETLRKDLK